MTVKDLLQAELKPQRKQNTKEQLAVLLSTELGIETSELDPHSSLYDLGLDSLSALELRHKLELEYGLQLPGTLFNDYATYDLLADFFTEDVTYPALYVPPLTEADSAALRTTAPSLPVWYRCVMWPSKQLFKLRKYWASHPEHRTMVAPTDVYSAAPEYAACSNVDINVAWTQMRATYYFPAGVDDAALKRSLAQALNSFPSFTGRLVEKRGDLYIEYGGRDACVPFEVHHATEWAPADFIGTIIPGLWRLSVSVWLWQFFASNVGVALCFAWKAYTDLFGGPLFRVAVTHIHEAREPADERVHRYPLFTLYHADYGKAPAMDARPAGPREGTTFDSTGVGGSYLTIDWMHSIADGSTIGRFLSLWSAAHQGLPLVMMHPSPSESLSLDQQNALNTMLLNEAPVPRLYKSLPGTGLEFARFLITQSRLDGVKEGLPAGISDSDATTAIIWKAMANLSSSVGKEPKVTFLQDLRLSIPELQGVAGNMLRFLPLLYPAMPHTDASVASQINIHRKSARFGLDELMRTGVLQGVPCCWSELHRLVRAGEGPILAINDLAHFDSVLSFGDGCVGRMPAESFGWRPDIPEFDIVDIKEFAGYPCWQAWLTHAPNGIVVSLFSMP